VRPEAARQVHRGFSVDFAERAPDSPDAREHAGLPAQEAAAGRIAGAIATVEQEGGASSDLAEIPGTVRPHRGDEAAGGQGEPLLADVFAVIEAIILRRWPPRIPRSNA